MRTFIALVSLFASIATAYSTEPATPSDNVAPMVGVTLDSHASIVAPYLRAKAAARDARNFDSDAAWKDVNNQFPDTKPVRGEFETTDEFAKRVESEMARLQTGRQKVYEALKMRHEMKESQAAVARKRVTDLQVQFHDRLDVVFPTTAPRYEIDVTRYPTWPGFDDALSETDYGLARMKIQFNGRGFSCPEETAKRIRTVSDAGKLWTVVGLKDAKIEISVGQETVARSSNEQVGEAATNAGVVIGAVIIAELLSPGSTRGVQTAPPPVARTKSIQAVTVAISGDAFSYELYDAGAKSWLLKAKN